MHRCLLFGALCLAILSVPVCRAVELTDIVSDLRTQLERHEGRRYRVYCDSRGHATIGIGFVLARSDAQCRLARIGLDYGAVRDGSHCMSDGEIDSLLDDDILAAIEDADAVVPDYASLPRTARLVFANMAFNLGRSGLRGFTNMLAAVEDGDWPSVVREMVDSRWHHQVAGRAQELEDLIAGLTTL